MVHVDVPLVFPRRGRYVLEPLEACCGFPLGLADCRRTLQESEEIVVLPRLGLLRRGALRRHLQRHSPTLGKSKAFPQRHPSAQTDFHGLRVFHPGDSPRWIHWRTTARRGELMIKEFEEMPSDNLILIVDPYLDSLLPPAQTEANLELALRLAATICWEWNRQKGDRMILGIAGADPYVRGGLTSRELAVDMLQHLAVETGGPTSRLDLFLEKMSAVNLPPASVLVVSTHPCEFVARIEQTLRRPVAVVDVSQREFDEFYEEDLASRAP